ncbi:hypothetical protein C8035_v008487 [Colletotrichum spinosum]|uniref:Uncharacterized protein n=1 Tax=Colletotrichum spinosum TaxID=1347390 RepID=A0A4R8QNF4_9PEZI|nr:hypothetical protein C8035_v008487 [Colletotrichum spinosum]
MHLPTLLAASQAGSALSCALYAATQYPQIATYNYDCRDLATDAWGLSVCLLQRNTLNTIMGCANSNANEILSWTVAPGSRVDSLDLIPSDTLAADKLRLMDNDGDGLLRVTPRGLLLVASRLPACKSCRAEDAFLRCPYEDYQKFIGCLCCESVSAKKISCLEDCIYSSGYGPFSQPKQFQRMPWSCKASCVKPRRKGTASNVEDAQSAEYPGSDNSTLGSCDADVYKVVDGERVSDCDDAEAFSNTLTLLTTVTSWGKLDQYTVPTGTASGTNTFGAEVATGTAAASAAADGAAQTVSLASSSAATSAGSAASTSAGGAGSGVGANAVPLKMSVLVLLVAVMVLFVYV